MAKNKEDTPVKTLTTRVRANNTPTAVKNLQTWLRECLFTISEDDDAARFSRVVARQLVKGNKRGEEAFYVDVPKKAGEDWCDTAALEIWGKLQNETASLGGLQKYALYAFHSNDSESHISRFIVRIQGVDEEDDNNDGLNSEAPDKTGLTSQAMRHAEVYAKTMSGMVMGQISAYQGTVQRLTTMVENLLEDKMQNIEAMKAVMDEKEERDIRVLKEKTKAEGMKDLIGRLGVLLPAVANKVAGKPIFPVEDSSMMMMAKALFTSMAANPEKLDKIMSILSTEEQIAFMNFYEEISSRNKEEADKELAASNQSQ
jgi:hypothetical protein